MHKLDPIERLPDGSLFRLTPGQLRSMRGLTKRCCNFSVKIHFLSEFIM